MVELETGLNLKGKVSENGGEYSDSAFEESCAQASRDCQAEDGSQATSQYWHSNRMIGPWIAYRI